MSTSQRETHLDVFGSNWILECSAAARGRTTVNKHVLCVSHQKQRHHLLEGLASFLSVTVAAVVLTVVHRTTHKARRLDMFSFSDPLAAGFGTKGSRRMLLCTMSAELDRYRIVS